MVIHVSVSAVLIVVAVWIVCAVVDALARKFANRQSVSERVRLTRAALGYDKPTVPPDSFANDDERDTWTDSEEPASLLEVEVEDKV